MSLKIIDISATSETKNMSKRITALTGRGAQQEK
jgi:hypothetical protein